MLTPTWCHRTPVGAPTRVSAVKVIRAENELDRVGGAGDVGRQVGAAALLHQGCPVTVRYCEVVARTVGTKDGMVANVERSKL